MSKEQFYFIDVIVRSFIHIFSLSLSNLDIDIDSDVYAAPNVCESQLKHDIEKHTESKQSTDNTLTSNIKKNDEIDCKEKSSSEMQKNDSTQNKESLKAELHIDGKK